MADPQQESVEIKSPGGWMAKLTGQNLFLGAIALGIAGGAWALVEHRSESQAAISQLEQQQNKALGAVTDALNRNADEQQVMNYILTLRPEDREKLRLDMPRSLRERMR